MLHYTILFIVSALIAGFLGFGSLAGTAENPWRCFHDGTKCTEVMYLGEG